MTIRILILTLGLLVSFSVVAQNPESRFGNGISPGCEVV